MLSFRPFRATLFAVLATAVLALAACTDKPAFKNLDITGSKSFGTDFSLTDHTGKRRTLQDFRKISILGVKGYCYGWHFYQAADADIVIASDDALFGHPAFRYAGAGPRMWQWATMMGVRKFQEMVFTGRPFTAEEMERCNFVNKVVPQAELMDAAQKMADMICEGAPLATQAAVRLYRLTGAYPAPLISYARELDQITAESEDGAEGPRAFREKRKPVWKGR